jgi:glycosyltransferase involved in cell wall biosynthesis
MSKLDISVVVPLYNEEESLPELVEWIDRVMKANNFSFEIILIDDGSTDLSWEVVEALAAKHSFIRGISFLRNYGKSAALFSGFDAAQGDVVITMDADLQDSPNEIPDLYRMIVDEKYDLVSGWKQKRYDPIGKRLPSKFFNATARFVSGIKLNDFNCGLKAYRRKVVKSVEVYGEMHRYIPVLAKQAGFKKIGEKVVEHQARKYGVTKFGWERFIHGFLDLLSVVFVSKFGKKPMHFFGTLGLITFILGGLMSGYMICEKVYHLATHAKVREVTDQPLFYISLTLVIIGAQLFLTGFLGELV